MFVRRFAFLAAVLGLLATLAATQELSIGTILPVMANNTVDSMKATPGAKLSFRLMQDIELPSGRFLRAGAKLEGRIVESSPANGAKPARVVVRLQRIISDKKETPIQVSLRALASTKEVFTAGLPVGTFDEYGTSVSDWTTVQVGGAAVYLGDTTLRDGLQVLGSARAYGVVRAKLIPAPKLGCPTREGEADREQALWVFSPWACGTYGFDDLTIAHHGNTAPVGDIELTAPGRVLVRGGSGWLLRVVGQRPSRPGAAQ